jgi:PHP family Zn ribbon phosphoesterase
MPVTTACAGCQIKLKVADDMLGKDIKCPKCGKTFKVATGGTGTDVSPAGTG